MQPAAPETPSDDLAVPSRALADGRIGGSSASPGRRELVRTSIDVAPLDVARRLLADPAVRSLTIDAAEETAAVHYHSQRTRHASLGWLSEQLQNDDMRLAETGVVPLPADSVECWAEPCSPRSNYVRTPEEARGWRRWMHLGLAGVWFTLAVLGAILPGLPCTCFLLLTSYSLCRSSKRLHEKLLNSKWFGPTLRHWRVHRGVRPGVKTKALSMLVLMVGGSLAFTPLPAVAWWAVAVAGAIGAGCISRLRVIGG